jgi:hypothetical protein
MNLEKIIDSEIKKAMLEKRQETLDAIRLIKSDIQVEKAKEGKDELTDAEVTKIIQKLISQSIESATQYARGGRIDLVDKEMFNATVYKTYLPEQLSEDEVASKVKDFITQIGATSVRDIGKVMAIANKELLGRADMKMVGSLAKNMLS